MRGDGEEAFNGKLVKKLQEAPNEMESTECIPSVNSDCYPILLS
jgi:hypothetical protein